MQILYAENDPDDVTIFCEALHEIDSKIICEIVSDGYKVVPHLDKSPSLPDFIFLDYNMPVMKGAECLKLLKANDRYRSIPVVLYSTNCTDDIVEKIKQLGATNCIQKPNSFSATVSALRKTLESLK
jgi:CheY-like chemotaxis protein